MDLDSLEALLDFVARHGDAIVSAWEPKEQDYPMLELYDTYRE